MNTVGSNGIERSEECVLFERGRAFSLHEGGQRLSLSDSVAVQGGDEVFWLLRWLPFRVGQCEVDKRHLGLTVFSPRVVIDPETIVLLFNTLQELVK